MSRYIDADALKNKITELDGGCAVDGIGFDIYTCEVFELIDEVPTADVVEVKHGEWIDGLDIPKEERERHPYVYLHGDKYCSVCYEEAYFDTDYGQQLFDYCPNCGADMRGGQHD